MPWAKASSSPVVGPSGCGKSALLTLDRTAIERFPGNGFLVLEESIKTRWKELVGLGRSYAKGTVFTLNNPEAAVRIVYEMFPQTKPTRRRRCATTARCWRRACRTGCWNPSG